MPGELLREARSGAPTAEELTLRGTARTTSGVSRAAQRAALKPRSPSAGTRRPSSRGFEAYRTGVSFLTTFPPLGADFLTSIPPLG
jgi:hypothetical protein